ncbi:helix-turn-helix transcriptional regulator [Paenibacillus sp. FSL K6-1230]|uniref:helix-turn-helix transcriptional regulator n=1 Tax=Paenibacillus sp. FSL K6-1230 TaxID=2921603 RepID=UPI0003AA7E41
MSPNESCKVLTAGFSFHRRPYYSSQPEGIRNYMLRLQTDGSCRARIGSDMVEVVAGDLLLLHPSEPYELTIDSETDATGDTLIESSDYHIFFTGPWAEAWWKQRKRPAKMRVELNESLLNIFRQIVMEQRRIFNPYPEISEYYMRILCLEIDRLLAEQPVASQHGYLAFQIKHYIEENASTAFKLDDVAGYLGISVSRAVHLFKETFDTTIMRYALEVRLNMARERIIFSPMSLEQAAESSGFANYTYFHRVFRAKYGISPSQYRAEHREQL